MENKTYSEKLKHPKWQRKRLKILERDNFKCTLCGDGETELHVHHLKYTGEPWDAPDKDLKTHCKYCHHLVELYKDDEFIEGRNFGGGIALKTKTGNVGLFKKADNGTCEHIFTFSKNCKVLKTLYKMSNGEKAY